MYREMSSDEDSDDAIKHLLKLNPSKLQAATKYALFYSSVIVTLISIFILTGRDPTVLEIRLLIGETFMHSRVKIILKLHLQLPFSTFIIQSRYYLHFSFCVKQNDVNCHFCVNYAFKSSVHSR